MAAIAALRSDAATFKANQKRGRDSRVKMVALQRRGSTPKGGESPAKIWTERLHFDSLFHLPLACSLGERALPTLTGCRLDTETTSIVQAAHIHQHAVSGNDDPRNGIALTPDAHWMFDAGLWTVITKGDDLLSTRDGRGRRVGLRSSSVTRMADC